MDLCTTSQSSTTTTTIIIIIIPIRCQASRHKTGNIHVTVDIGDSRKSTTRTSKIQWVGWDAAYYKRRESRFSPFARNSVDGGPPTLDNMTYHNYYHPS
jgi:hypothetical protein